MTGTKYFDSSLFLLKYWINFVPNKLQQGFEQKQKIVNYFFVKFAPTQQPKEVNCYLIY